MEAKKPARNRVGQQGKMSMRRFSLVLLPALALAACNSSPTVQATNATGAEVAEKVQKSGIADQFISPGQWQMVMTINEMTMPGLPPEAAARMKGMMGRGRTFTQCVTPEEAKRPREKMFAGDANSKCKYDNFTMGGGKIGITMSCGGPVPRKMQMNGSYGPNEYHMKVVSNGEGKNGPGASSMNMQMDAKRIGECTAEQLKEEGKG